MTEEELRGLREVELERQAAFRCRIFCCGSTACLAAGASSIMEAISEEVEQHEINAKVEVLLTGCMGLCSSAPLIALKLQDRPEVTFERITADMASLVVDAALAGDLSIMPQDRVLTRDHPFFAKQAKVALSNSGLIDPENIDHYIARGGYNSLSQALYFMTPEEVCEEVKNSGLRGRGGAGYPTGVKWNLMRKAQGETKYVVANGDEGDPGAYMDRTLMESDPHLVLEGMAIAAYAVGADRGYIYVRGEYPLASTRIEKAIKAAEKKGLLGSHVLGSKFSFRVDIRIGAGAFVCGEETALMASIMGRRGQPIPRPPYPAESGLWSCPTLINNVESFASIAPIIQNGSDWYGSIGTEKSKGTKIFALAGKIKNTGLIEVPMGISLREIVFEIGGGVPDGQKFKAAQTGGPSGGCIPAEFLDTPVDYESLGKLGSIMGSGGLIIMDETSSMPEVAKFFMEFCEEESCGKCVPCRIGTAQAVVLLKKICDGKATWRDLATLEELCELLQNTSLCGLGQSAPNPLLSTLQYFRSEYEKLLSDSREKEIKEEVPVAHQEGGD